jgi:folate-binding Fe-S cluster repair protein YgfZ
MPAPSSVRALVRATPTIVRLQNRALISVSGSQAAEFLNGLLSTAVTTQPYRSFFSSFLHAQVSSVRAHLLLILKSLLNQGRVICDVFVHAMLDDMSRPAYLIEYDATAPADVPALLPMIKRHVLRSKVRVRDASEEYDVWAAWGNDVITGNPRQWTRTQGGTIEPLWDSWPWGSGIGALIDRRADGMGLRRLVRKGDRRE